MQTDLRQVQTKWEQFVKSATLDVIFPKTKTVEPSDVATLGATDVDRLPSRQYVLFDEIVNLQVILRARQSPEAVQDILSHLELTVAAHATNATAEGNSNVNPATTKHDVASVKKNAIDYTASHSLSSVSHVVWKATIPMTRPRARLQRPTIYFTAHLSLSESTIEQIKQSTLAYMPSYEALPANVLAPLHSTPGLTDTDLFLSEQRLTRIVPTITQPDSLPKALRGTSRRAYPAMPALFPRIQYQTLPGTSVVALHLMASDLLPAQLTIHEARIAVSGRSTERVDAIKLPQSMQPSDCTSLLFRLPEKHDNTASQIVTASLISSVLLEADNEVDLTTTWQAPLDPVQAQDHVVHHEWTDPTSRSSQHLPAHSSSHVTFTISAPARATVGQQFAVRVLCVNNSASDRTFVAAWTDDRTDVLVYNPQHKIGPMRPGACFEVDFRVVAECTGLLDFGSLDIEDLHTGSMIRLRDLPDVESAAPRADAIDSSAAQ